MLATIVLGVTILVFERLFTPLSLSLSAILSGIGDGFCGCLSTLSTFVVELDTLAVRYAYVYAFISVGVGLVVLVIIVGLEGLNVGWQVDIT